MFWDTNNIEGCRRVLVIPNYTFSSNYEQDSFVDVINKHINTLGDEFYWIIPVPKGNPITKLNKPNVKQVECSISGDMIKMRSNFPLDVINLIKNEIYDVVYSHLPDWSVGRFTKVPIIGYSHWWEMKECNGISWLNYSLNLSHQLHNIMDWDVCYVNTHQQKKMVLDNASEWFNEKTIEKLDNTIQVLHLSLDEKNIVSSPSSDYDRIIVFNHRTEKYKGWDRFLTMIRKYREHRQDFKVWAPLLDKPINESWILSHQFPKHQYYEELSKCCVGVQPKQLHAGWSVSATDCMMRGLPMLFEEQDCFYEIDSEIDTFSGYKEFQSKLDSYLDNRNYRMERAEISIEGARRVSNNIGEKLIKNKLL